MLPPSIMVNRRTLSIRPPSSFGRIKKLSYRFWGRISFEFVGSWHAGFEGWTAGHELANSKTIPFPLSFSVSY